MMFRSLGPALAAISLVWLATAAPQTQKDVVLFNEAGVTIDVYWVHPQTKEIHRMTGENEVKDGMHVPLKSFADHEFEIHEAGDCGTSAGGDSGVCRRTVFQVTPHDDQKVYLTTGFEAIVEDSTMKAKAQAGDVISHCHNQAKRQAKTNPTPEEMALTMNSLLSCVEDRVARDLIQSHEEVAFQATVRKEMAAKLENYTCEDPDHPSSEPVREEIWSGSKDHQPRPVHVMHDRPASKIHIIEHFIDPEECEAMEQAAEPILHRATVADGSGGSKFSEHRKAMQAGIKVPWHLEAEGNPIARLSRRVYDYSNHVLGLNLEEHGQEDLMSIQYFGRGYNDTAPDRYTPHCDGDCTGLSHKYGTRMATMVMYCKIPQHGGHTNFRNSGIHFKPSMGSAVFFSYIDPETKIMDTGFTEHSGCPVFEGEKKIVTQWIRYGVDAENPWDSFNTLGIKKSEENDY